MLCSSLYATILDLRAPQVLLLTCYTLALSFKLSQTCLFIALVLFISLAGHLQILPSSLFTSKKHIKNSFSNNFFQ